MDVDTLGFFVFISVVLIVLACIMIGRRRAITRAEREMRDMYGKDWG